MFKGFSKSNGFHSFPSLGRQARSRSMINFYGKDKCGFRLDAGLGLQGGITNGSLMSEWTDTVFGVNYLQPTATKQPKWIESDPSFNGLPVIHCDARTEGFLSDQLNGPAFGIGQTVAVVYQGFTVEGGGSPYPLGVIYGDWSTYGNSRNTAICYAWNTSHSVSGYYVGRDNPKKTSSDIADNLVHIAVISSSSFVADGSVLSLAHDYPIAGGLITAIGGNGAYGPGGTFKIAELVVWNQDYTDSQCLEICDQINSKYAIY